MTINPHRSACVRALRTCLISALTITAVALHAPLSLAQVAAQAGPEKVGIDQFVVKVTTREASPFTGQVTGGGHGTGFVVDIDPNSDEVTIFTNKHVVARTNRMAQSIVIEVTNGENMPEIVPAKVDYISQLLDFAVLKINRRDLVQTGQKLRAVTLPPDDHPFFEFVKNLSVIQRRMAVALGNPLMSEQIATEGPVSGRISDMVDGDYIQTQAPINPGNSGGPLLDAETGIVIGMNTAIIKGANNVGMAIPIGELIEDYRAFKKDKMIALAKTPPVTFDLVTRQSLQLLGLDEVLSARFPDLFNKTKALIQITDAKPDGNAGFKTGDIIITVEGQIIGTQYFDYKKIIQRQTDVTVEVLRNGQIVTLKQTYPVERTRRLREAANFVLVSGLLFTQDTPRNIWSSTGTGGLYSVVRLAGAVINDPEMAFSAGEVPPPESMVVGVNINGKDYPVKTLFDLKMALRENPTARAMRLDVRVSLWQMGPDKQPQILKTSNGSTMLSGTLTTHIVPITSVHTVADFSLERFRQQFSFDPRATATRNLGQWMQSTKAERQARSAGTTTASSTSCSEKLGGLRGL